MLLNSDFVNTVINVAKKEQEPFDLYMHNSVQAEWALNVQGLNSLDHLEVMK